MRFVSWTCLFERRDAGAQKWRDAAAAIDAGFKKVTFCGKLTEYAPRCEPGFFSRTCAARLCIFMIRSLVFAN